MGDAYPAPIGSTASVPYKFLRHLLSSSLLHFSCPRMFLHFAVSVFPVNLTDLTSQVLRNSPSASAPAMRSAAVRKPVEVSFITTTDGAEGQNGIDSQSWGCCRVADSEAPINPRITATYQALDPASNVTSHGEGVPRETINKAEKRNPVSQFSLGYNHAPHIQFTDRWGQISWYIIQTLKQPETWSFSRVFADKQVLDVASALL